jgi:uncharacterized repeat protein (TIGR03806 family)
MHNPRPLPLLSFAMLAAFVLGDSPENLDRSGVPRDRPGSRAFLNFPRDDHGAIPAQLSRTGAFRNTATLEPAEGLLAYELNTPFWSDGAAKRRWISIPGGQATSKVGFSMTGEMTFPAGTVFVKHFELNTDEAHPSVMQRLETRLLVVDEHGGVFGAAYRWRADQTDADLVEEARSAPVLIKKESGIRTQNWSFPGRADCRQCHTQASGGVLGVNARQLNRDSCGPSGLMTNQLRVWDGLGLFDRRITEAEYPRIARLARLDDPSRSLEDRARSFLDANCAACHRPGGAAADFDARYDTPLAGQKIIGERVRINLGVDGARFIAPNDPWRSTILARVETLEQTRMPPLAHEVVDRQAASLLREWIASLPGPPVVAPPTIHPGSGDFHGAVGVSIRHEDPDALIRYTVDGNSPGKASPEYTGPFEVRRSTTVRARAYKLGHTRSIAVGETLVIGD